MSYAGLNIFNLILSIINFVSVIIYLIMNQNIYEQKINPFLLISLIG